LFHLGNFRRHADDNPGMHEHLAVVGLVDEIVEHLLGDFEVRDDAVFQGANGDDVAWRAPQHILGFASHRLDFSADLIDGDDGGFVNHNALAPRENKGVGGPKVNREVGGENAEQRTYIHRLISARLFNFYLKHSGDMK